MAKDKLSLGSAAPLAMSGQRNLEDALRLSEQRFQGIFDNSFIGMAIVSVDGHWIQVNEAFCRMLGYTPDELASKTFQDVTHPDDVEASLTHRAQLLAGKADHFRHEKRYVHKDGHEVWVRLGVALVRDEKKQPVHFVAQAEDISEYVKARVSLEWQASMLRAQQETSPDAILLVDEQARIVSYNQRFVEMWHIPPALVQAGDDEPVLQTAMMQLRDPEQALAKVRSLYASREEMSQDEFEFKDGRIGYRYSSPVLGENGQYYGRVWYFRDITERKEAERALQGFVEQLTNNNIELQQLNEKLKQAQSQLLQSEKMASIGSLAAGIAHEINNPVGYIKSNMQTLEKYVADMLRVVDAYAEVEAGMLDQAQAFSKVRRLMQDIDYPFEKEDILALLAESAQGVERVTKIVRDLKDFAHADREEIWAMDDIHRGLESTLTVVWNELKYTCEVKKEYGSLPQIECLLPQLNQVFMNLLVNAAQAIDTKGVVTIRTGVEGEGVWVEIADTGKGIAQQDLKRIFDPFFTTKPVGKGTGLGLSVSYNIIQKHHGRIEVKSSPGKGAAFHIWLPLKQPPREQ